MAWPLKYPRINNLVLYISIHLQTMFEAFSKFHSDITRILSCILEATE
jgi:hypothetical protein